MAAEVAVETVQLTPARCAVAHAWLNAETYALLEREAERRRVHPDVLAAEILRSVLSGELTDAMFGGEFLADDAT